MNIAIVGASRDRERFSNKAVRAYRDAGWGVFPVNLKDEEVEGLECFSSIKDIPDDLDAVSFYVKPDIGVSVADDVIEKGVKTAYLNPGADADELAAKLKDGGVTPLRVCSIRALGVDPDEV